MAPKPAPVMKLAPVILDDFVPVTFEKLFGDGFAMLDLDTSTSDQVAEQYVSYHEDKAEKADNEKLVRKQAAARLINRSEFRLLHDYTECPQCKKQRRVFHETGVCGRCVNPPDSTKVL